MYLNLFLIHRSLSEVQQSHHEIKTIKLYTLSVWERAKSFLWSINFLNKFCFVMHWCNLLINYFYYITLLHQGFSCHGEALLYSVTNRQAAKDLIGPVRQRLANYNKTVWQTDVESIQVRLLLILNRGYQMSVGLTLIMLNFLNEIICKFLALSIISFRDIKRKTWRWSANSIIRAWLYTGGKYWTLSVLAG